MQTNPSQETVHSLGVLAFHYFTLSSKNSKVFKRPLYSPAGLLVLLKVGWCYVIFVFLYCFLYLPVPT